MRQDVGVDGDAQRLSQLSWLLFLKILDDQDKELEILEKNYNSTLNEEYRWRNWAGNREGLTGDNLIKFISTKLFPYLKEIKLIKNNHERTDVVKEVFKDSYNYMKSGQLLRQVINKVDQINFNSLKDRKHFGLIYERLLNSLQSAGNAGEFYTPRAITEFIANRLDPNPKEKVLDPACGTGGMITCCLDHMRKKYVKTVSDEKLMQNNIIGYEKKPFPFILCVTNMLLKNILNPNFIKYDNTLSKPFVSWSKEDRVNVVVSNPPFAGKEEPGMESNFPAQFRTRETADLFLALIVRLLKKDGRAGVVMPDGTMFGDNKVKTYLKKHLLEETNVHTIIKLQDSVFKPYANKQTFILFFEKGSKTKDIWYYEIPLPESIKSHSMSNPILFEHFNTCIEWWGGKNRKSREKSKYSWNIDIQTIIENNYNLDFKNPYKEKEKEININKEILLHKKIIKETETISNKLYQILDIEEHLKEKNIFFDLLNNDKNLDKIRLLLIKSIMKGKSIIPSKDDSIKLIEKINEFKKKNSLKGLYLGKKNNDGIPENWCWVPSLFPSDSKSENKEAVFKRDILKNGKYPVVDQGKAFIRGYSNEKDKVINCNHNKPLIIFGDHTREIKYIDFDFIVGADGVKIIQPLFINPKYYFLALEWLNIKTRGYGRHFKILRSSLIPLPPIIEQERLVLKVHETDVLLNDLFKNIKYLNSIKENIFNGLERVKF